MNDKAVQHEHFTFTGECVGGHCVEHSRDPGEGLGTNAEPRKEGEPVPDIDARIERLLDQLEDPYLTEAKEQTLRRRLKTLQEFQERERVKSA